MTKEYKKAKEELIELYLSIKVRTKEEVNYHFIKLIIKI